MNKQELFDSEKQLMKECVEDKSKTMGEVVAKAGWGPKFSTVLDMGYLNLIQISLIIFPRNKAGKDLSFRAWCQHTGWAVYNHKFIEDIQKALNNQPSIVQLFKLATGHILQCKGANLSDTSLWFSDSSLVFPEGDGEEDLEGWTWMKRKKKQRKMTWMSWQPYPLNPTPTKDKGKVEKEKQKGKGKGKEKEQAGGSSNLKASMKSCKIIGVNLDLQIDMEYEEQARAAQVLMTEPAPLAHPQQRPAPYPVWAKIMISLP
ncbi:hypothetical protein FRC10_000913 [Ceratobasidium sp. 414]|nr:hypothetical protein FRC10_000913 [Ceratobasidium sp. 414]